MDDLISRQAAIDAINHICPVDTEYDCTLLDRVDVRYVLSYLPTAQPKRMRGRWMEVDGWDGDVIYQCSECKEEFVLIDGTPQDNLYHYCPNCGARMDRGEE